ncbi:MAG: ABC transporter transmembrane domain-containing protein [Pseudomonadota bacterium]
MDAKFFTFVWRHSKRDQLIILALTFLSFPLVYISLEIPKIIINEAISGTDFPKDFYGLELDQVPYLLVLCGLFLFMVVAINGIKWVMNVQIGMTGERMLRRLRFMLFERVMLFKMTRFRTTKPGEIIQSILGEIEPLGGFIGEVIATPCFQGGLLCVYVTFIFVQDWTLGLAAIALYPFQAWLIPKLQAKIVRLNKERAGNTRTLADTIGEAVNVVGEIHTNDTARWHLAQTAGRLYSNTVIRLALFKRKFTIKFINNFLNQLTPFFFYSAGGYLVIKGDLDFGSLVAVLAAYKDVAAPWKAVLNYVQRWADFNSRYVFVIENFSGDDILEAKRIYAEGRDAEPLSGPLEFNSVEGGPGTSGLSVSSLTIAPGQMAAVTGGNSGGREAFLKLAAGLQEPASGRVTMGGAPLIEATLPQIGKSIAFVGSEPGIVAKSMRENLLYGLFRGAPDLSDSTDAELANMLSEARLTGNSTANPNGDWIDYARAGVDDPAALDARMLELIEIVGLSPELYSGALDMRLDPDLANSWNNSIMQARELIHNTGLDFSDVLEEFEIERFNSNASILENVLYGLPVRSRARIADYLDDKSVVEVFDRIGATQELKNLGWDIAREFSELVEALDGDSTVLDSFAGYAKGEIMAAHDLVIANAGKAKPVLKPDQVKLLMSLALTFSQTRDRLDVLDDDRIERLLACRLKAYDELKDSADFVTFDENRVSPARTVAGNIVLGKRRHDRKSAWKRLEDDIEAAITEAGLRDDLIRLGLTRQLGSGTGLSSSTKRRIGLVRALIKRPELLILDGIAGTASKSDYALRFAILSSLPNATILYGAADEEAAERADLVIEISESGAVRATEGAHPDGNAQRAPDA